MRTEGVNNGDLYADTRSVGSSSSKLDMATRSVRASRNCSCLQEGVVPCDGGREGGREEVEREHVCVCFKDGLDFTW